MATTATLSARAVRLVAVAVVLAAWSLAVVVSQSALWADDAFTDVPDGNVHHASVGAIVDDGVTSGCAEGRYCPADPVRRDQMASFMDRLGALSGQPPVVNAATAQRASDSDALGGVDAAALLERIEALESGAGGGDLAERVAALEGHVEALEADNAALQGRVDELEATLEGVSRGTVGGRDTLAFAGMNLQVVNGTGSTDGDPNGLGNIIVGYNAPHADGTAPADRAGSHYLVVGDSHHWTSFGGLVAGLRNTATGAWASALGDRNTASGDRSAVTGGSSNTASGLLATVSGGSANLASGTQSSVTGGRSNTASSRWASVNGGHQNVASTAEHTTVSGGLGNVANGGWATVGGGRDNTASGLRALVAGGEANTASGDQSSVSGGSHNVASGDWSSVSGGFENTASGSWSSILGGDSNTVSSGDACHPGC